MPITNNTGTHAIGLSNLHFAKITKDDSSGVTYDEVISVPEIISVSIEPQTNETSLYADNMSVDVASTTPEYNISIELAGLSLEVRAFLLGHTYTNGKIVVNSEDTAPFVGMAFESLTSKGTKRYSKFLKVKFTQPNENPQTKGENVEFQTATIEGKAIFRTYDSKSYEAADESEGFSDGSTWYTFASLP